MDEQEERRFKLDVSEMRDWANAMMNLIEAEGHLEEVIGKVDEENTKRYVALLDAIRKLRGEFFEQFLRDKTYGIWCWSKHVLSAVKQLREVGVKEIDKGIANNDEKAVKLGVKYLKRAQELFEAFCAHHMSFELRGCESDE